MPSTWAGIETATSGTESQRYTNSATQGDLDSYHIISLTLVYEYEKRYFADHPPEACDGSPSLGRQNLRRSSVVVVVAHDAFPCPRLPAPSYMESISRWHVDVNN
ncbi:hypothetical protein ANN_05386 [Periplaneta americana]|uniref:Uncharacterized protein n=1 Tax=Periplaneta americana TaxID=6978 RepID=A0ABQ8TAY8_PERAM|nr:hypothetical protein ANN_05386 [Periplaneta americana]